MIDVLQYLFILLDNLWLPVSGCVKMGNPYTDGCLDW